MENEIDKQEREIIESLEREEKEHKKYLASSPSGRLLLLIIKLGQEISEKLKYLFIALLITVQ